jgi:hypothetical protein
MHGVSLSAGKLLWSQPMDSALEIVPWQQPVVDSAPPDTNHTLVWTAKKSAKTVLFAADLPTGRLLWTKGVNGTAQVPLAPDGPSGMGLSGGKVILETCKGVSCCLRAFNLTNGKARWVICLDAVRGVDATHPKAQFAIWLITVVTVGSIALLVVVALMVYMQRWYEDRRILQGSGGEALDGQGYMQLEGAPPSGGLGLLTPARNYRPLPQLSPQHSDSEDSPRRRFEGSPAVPAAMLVQQQQGRWEHQQQAAGILPTAAAAAAAAGLAGAPPAGGLPPQPPEARPGQVGAAGQWYGTLPRVQGQRRHK